MPPSHLTTELVALLVMTMTGVGSGCAVLSKTPAGEATASYRDAALLDADQPGLLVEVDYLADCEPRPRALRIFEQRLAFYTDKPGGITVMLDDVIDAVEWEQSRDAIVRIVRAHADERDAGRGYLYVLYAPAYKKFRGYSFRVGVLDEAVDFPVMTVFVSQLRPILWLTGVRQETSVLVHEAAHTCGLVTNDDHRDGGHCTNSWCLMYDGVDARSLLVNLVPTLFTGYLPTHLCRDCRDDLWPDQRVPGRRGIPGLPSDDHPGCDPFWE